MFCIFSESKQRVKWIMVSTSLTWERNLFPNPSPLEAPLTRPAISTYVIAALIVLADLDILDILFNLSSGSATIPIFGSMVQKENFQLVLFLMWIMR